MLFSQQQVLETIAWRQRQDNDRLNLEVGHRIRTEFSDVFDVVASLTAPVGRSVCRPQQPLQPRATGGAHTTPLSAGYCTTLAASVIRKVRLSTISADAASAIASQCLLFAWLEVKFSRTCFTYSLAHVLLKGRL